MPERRGFDLNSASRDELVDTHMIDGKRADELIRHRPFSSWDEVKDVPSFEDGMVERLQDAGATLGGTRSRGEQEEGRGAAARRSEGASGSREERSTNQGSSGSRSNPSRSNEDRRSGGREENDRRMERGGGQRSRGGGGFDLNTASEEDLESVFQIDGRRASELIRRRPFSSWDDVKAVPGFDDGMVENIREAGGRIGRT